MFTMHTATFFASAKVAKLTQVTSDACDVYDAEYHWGGISIYPADPQATDISYPGLPVGVHLPPGLPIHLDLLVTPAPSYLAHIPLVCPGAPRPDAKPKGSRPQPVKPAPRELKETEPAQIPKAEPAQTPKLDSKPVEPIKGPKTTSKSSGPTEDSQAKTESDCTLPGVYGTTRRLPGSRPYFIYAFPYDGERWAHLPQSRHPIECKSKDAKHKSIENMDIETCMFNDPVLLGTCIAKPKTKKKLAANNMASVFAAAAKEGEESRNVAVIPSGKFESGSVDSSRSSSASDTSLNNDHAENVPSKGGGSGFEWGDEEEKLMPEDEDNPPASSNSPPTSTKPSPMPAKSASISIHEELDSDTELIDLDLEPAIRQLQFPAQSPVYHAPTLASSRPSFFGSHLHNALANFRARYAGSLSSLSSSSGGSRLSVESKGPSTPLLGRDEGYIHVPKNEDGWFDDEVDMGNGAIPMRVLRR